MTYSQVIHNTLAVAQIVFPALCLLKWQAHGESASNLIQAAAAPGDLPAKAESTKQANPWSQAQ